MCEGPLFGTWSKLIMVSSEVESEAGNLSKNRHLDVSDILQLIHESDLPFFGIALLYFGMVPLVLVRGVISCPPFFLIFFIFHFSLSVSRSFLSNKMRCGLSLFPEESLNETG